MSLRQSGFYCDICNKAMVTEMMINKRIKSFKMEGFDNTFHYHDSCKPILENVLETGNKELLEKDTPIYECIRQIEEHNKKFEKV